MRKIVLTGLFIAIFIAPVLVFGQIHPVPPYDIYIQMGDAPYYGSHPQYYDNPPFVYSPNGGEFWRFGEYRYISWNQTACGGYGCLYDIYLLGAGCSHPATCSMSPSVIARGINGGTYQWQVGRTLSGDSLKGAYKIAVCTLGSYQRCDASDSSFTIDRDTYWYRWPKHDYDYPVYPNVGIYSITPASGSTLSGTVSTFSWNVVGGASEYFVDLGTSLGAKNIFSSSTGLNTSVTITNIPPNGANLYLRVWYRLGLEWFFRDFNYKSVYSGYTTAPSVTLKTSMPLGQTITAPANISLEALAFDTDGTVVMVQFYQDVVWIGSVTNAPYTWTVPNVGIGTHTYTAVAVDNSGARTTSSSLTVTVSGGGGSGQLISPILQILPVSSFYKAPALLVLSILNDYDPAVVSRVVFYRNDIAIEEDSTKPFQAVMTQLGAGTYTFRANIYSPQGAYLGTSNAVTVQVVN